MRQIALVDRSATPPVVVPATVSRDTAAIRARLSNIEHDWSPARAAVAARHAATGTVLQNKRWQWTHLAQDYHQLLAVDCGGECQGLMAIKAAPLPARAAGGGNVLYVDFVEVAPWNKWPYLRSRYYAPVGLNLIAEAVRLSADAGCDGRIGLHALPQAESFYRDRTDRGCGMTDLGPNEHYNFRLTYFEFTAAGAAEFLRDRGL